MEQTGLGVNGDRIERPLSRRRRAQGGQNAQGMCSKGTVHGKAAGLQGGPEPTACEDELSESSVFSMGFPVSTSSLSIC